MSKMLQPQYNSDHNLKDDKIKRICNTLNLERAELDKCIDKFDITKTCRHITKRLYPDEEERYSMSVSTVPTNIIEAIHG